MAYVPTAPAETAAPSEANILLALPTAAVAVLRGERRERLMKYLAAWGHDDALLRYLDQWLADQPDLATLREAQARALLGVGQAKETLAALDALDATRKPTQTRNALRIRALQALDQHDAIMSRTTRPQDATPENAFAWLSYGDHCRAAGQLDDAAEAYEIAADLLPDGRSLGRRAAELAMARGDAATARRLMEDHLARNAERRPFLDEVRLLREIARVLGDTETVADLAADLAARECAEREPLEAEFGHVAMDDDFPLPEELPIEPPQSSVPVGILSPQSSPTPPPEAFAALHRDFGLAGFRPYQAEVIGRVLAGRDTLAIMPTGAGKSLTYQLPALLLPHATLVVSPLIALMKDQIEGLPPALAERATAINSTLSAGEVRERLAGIAAGRYKLVYVAPERLRQRPFLHALKRAGLSLFVVDEAHCVSLWGQSFRPDYLFLRAALDDLGNPPVLALTATAALDTQEEIIERLGPMERIVAPVFRPNLRFEVIRAGNRQEKEDAVVALCKEVTGPVIVYARARDACERIAAHLRRNGVQAAFYHAQTPDRAAVQERFMAGNTRVLVATVAFGMGVDKADVRAIVHFNLPQSIEAYYQEAGRAGRDGQPARCVLMYASADKSQMTTWLHQEAITRADLRGLYRTLRTMVPNRYGIASMDMLQRASDRTDETFVRVGVSMLERVGLLRRHFDVPRTATVTVRASGSDNPDLRALIAATGLHAGETDDFSLLDLAETLGRNPSALEADLLDWADAGALAYRGNARDPLIEMLPAPSDVAARIDTLLAEYQTAQDARIEAMAGYARGAICRHRALAAHFGQRLAKCETACDICDPAHTRALATRVRVAVGPRPDDDRPEAQRALAGLAAMPFAVGRRGLARVLTGATSAPIEPGRCAEFGALGHMAIKPVEAIIEQLIEDAYIRRDETTEYRLLTLTPTGRDALRDASLLPEWAREQSGQRAAGSARRQRTASFSMRKRASWMRSC